MKAIDLRKKTKDELSAMLIENAKRDRAAFQARSSQEGQA
jgi:ribosomal protein L29